MLINRIVEQTDPAYNLSGVNYSNCLLAGLGGVSINKGHSKSRMMDEWLY